MATLGALFATSGASQSAVTMVAAFSFGMRVYATTASSVACTSLPAARALPCTQIAKAPILAMVYDHRLRKFEVRGLVPPADRLQAHAISSSDLAIRDQNIPILAVAGGVCLRLEGGDEFLECHSIYRHNCVSLVAATPKGQGEAIHRSRNALRCANCGKSPLFTSGTAGGARSKKWGFKFSDASDLQPHHVLRWLLKRQHEPRPRLQRIPLFVCERMALIHAHDAGEAPAGVVHHFLDNSERYA